MKKNVIKTWGLLSHLGHILFQFLRPKKLVSGFNGSPKPSEMLSVVCLHKKCGLNTS